MKRLGPLLLCLVALPALAQSSTFRFSGYLTGRGIYVTGQPSWTTGGFGRLGVGAGGVNDDAYRGQAVAQLGLDWSPTTWLTMHGQGLARQEPSGTRGAKAGVVEAYVELHNEQWRLRAGQFFLGTSRENIDPLWTSPYTISYSALNSWIGEEFRPIGVDLQYKPNFYFSAGATAFRGNETMGTLLSWRGWSIGNRLSVYREDLPLPPVFSVWTPDYFVWQRPGTTAYGRNLSGAIGWSARARATLPERAMIQVTRVDNRGDRELYDDEYSWVTKFTIVSAEVGSPDKTILAAEYASGSTGMGPWDPRLSFVQADFSTAYLLLSHKSGRFRTSGRFDIFDTHDRDHSVAENNSEHGRSWTLAAFYEPTMHLRTGLEFVQVTGRRIAAEQSGFDGNTDGRTLTAEVRYSF
jgi:hypothetical protein